MGQPVRGRTRGCLGNQEKEPLRNPGLDTGVGPGGSTEPPITSRFMVATLASKSDTNDLVDMSVREASAPCPVVQLGDRELMSGPTCSL